MPNNEIKLITEIQTEPEDYENDYPAHYVRIYQCQKCKDIFELRGSIREITFDEEKKNHNCNA